MFCVLIIIDLIFQESFRQFSFYVLPVVFGLLATGLVMLFVTGVLAWRSSKKNAIYFLVSYSILIFFFVIAIFGNGYGILPYTVENPAYFGIILEISILSFALVNQYRDVQKDREALQHKLASQQQEMYQNYIDGIEKERNRIAGDLHDDIGSKLSHLQRILFHDKTSEPAQLMDEIIHEVRNISHDLAPTIANVSGLLPLIERLISDTRKETSINITLQVFDFKELLKPAQIIQLYRILQEALHNIVKHSQATEVDIQLFGHDNEINITIEDNGKGFDSEKQTDGLGLNQMKIRAESLGGRVEINSHLGEGTLILLQVPTHP